MNTAGAIAATAASRPRPNRVLVVNTDPHCQQTIREALKATASEVTFVHPHQEWTWIFKHPAAFSVVVIDASDTEIAFSLLETIKMGWPEVSVVFLSNDMQFWMESIQRGAYDMLPMPLYGPDLAWIVNGAFNRHRAA
jgi:DNA-binding NtrC family response regulator